MPGLGQDKFDLKSHLQATERAMAQAKAVFEQYLLSLRGGSSRLLVPEIKVDYFGQRLTLKELASVNQPHPSLITVSPWDSNALGDILLAIENSGFDLKPVSDGKVIRISLPPLTAEERARLIRALHQKAEETRIALRGIRQAAWEKVQAAEKAKALTIDDRYRAETGLNHLIDEVNRQIEAAVVAKEHEMARP